jgi:hypothetical protein
MEKKSSYFMPIAFKAGVPRNEYCNKDICSDDSVDLMQDDRQHIASPIRTELSMNLHKILEQQFESAEVGPRCVYESQPNISTADYKWDIQVDTANTGNAITVFEHGGLPSTTDSGYYRN